VVHILISQHQATNPFTQEQQVLFFRSGQQRQRQQQQPQQSQPLQQQQQQPTTRLTPLVIDAWLRLYLN
jgi:hypothetical protein